MVMGFEYAQGPVFACARAVCLALALPRAAIQATLLNQHLAFISQAPHGFFP